ncbi:hypothetical protein ACQY0O_001260 [Thecaphora frezii]
MFIHDAAAAPSGLMRDQEAVPTTALHLLKSFKECQERRVAHWHEYDDAFSTYLSQPSPSAPLSGDTLPSPPPLQDQSAMDGAASRTLHSCSQAAHAAGERIAITDDMLQEILHLVTQGLLECSHRARAIQTELALPHIDQPRLAALVDRIQNHENQLLRTTVQRDQLRKLALSQQRDYNHDVEQLQRTITELRNEIVQEMQEVAAEMAELDV